MTDAGNSSDLLSKAMIVGTIHSPGSLKTALGLREGAVDFLEIRVDSFATDLAPLNRALPRLRIPRIVTVRHPAEGGANALGFARRRELYREFLPHAEMIDVELRSAEKLADILGEAQATGVKVILSSHDFRRTPATATLQKCMARAHRAGADVCKIAARADRAAELHRLLGLLAGAQRIPLSVMAMGRLGKVSRLVLASAGSVLNYGYLHRANASGQWEARELKKRLAELEG
jgi:3-dehydroquinate dehydratase-1